MTEFSTTSGTQHELLDQLFQQFLAQRRDGEAPDIEEYARLYPEVADDIRELFPAAVFAEQLHSEATNRNLSGPIHQAMQLGPFHLQREIGSGGMGVVYEATQSPFAQKFAVKVLKSSTLRSPTLEARFAREAQAVSRLHHPNIVPAKHYGTEANQKYLVMPMIEGISLDKLIFFNQNVDPKLYLLFEDICSNWSRVARLGSQIASALNHAHSNGMIHRDIKPANLILDYQSKIWVTDFGLAKLCDDDSGLSRTGELIGTPRYMAPEQILGVADERSDIYSVGLTLYDIVARESAFNRHDNSCSINKLGRKQKTSVASLTPLLGLPDIRKVNPHVPQRLAAVIMKACSHSPRARFQNARELEIALNEVSYTRGTDRRQSCRSRASDSKNLARSLGVLLGVSAIFAIAFGLYRPFHETELPKQLASSTGSAPATSEPSPLAIPEHNQYIYPLTHCITYDEPGTDLVNVITRVNRKVDDAEERSNGETILTDSELEMAWNETRQIVGLRFAGVEIAPGAAIHSAKLCFYAELDGESATALKIFGLTAANPASFAKLDYDISNRQRTERFVSWSPEEWKVNDLYESPECKEIVQSIVDSPNWRFGNAMAFVLEGNGNRTATAYDENCHRAPFLKIQYKKQVGLMKR